MFLFSAFVAGYPKFRAYEFCTEFVFGIFQPSVFKFPNAFAQPRASSRANLDVRTTSNYVKTLLLVLDFGSTTVIIQLVRYPSSFRFIRGILAHAYATNKIVDPHLSEF